MKAKTFENLIRKVVREEIDYALRREIKILKEDLRDELKPSIVEHKERMVKVPSKEISKNVKSTLKEKIMGTQLTKQRPKQSFTSNNTLNDLLNETAQGDTNLERGSAPVNLSQPFNTADPIPIESMPTEVASVVNKDYRELMRAIDKKKKHRP